MTSKVRLGVQTITIGSRDSCDIRLLGDAVLPLEGEVVHSGGGVLTLVPAPGSDWQKNGVPCGSEPFRLDPLAVYQTHRSLLDPLHPVLLKMQCRRGELPFTLGEIVLGREPSECHLYFLDPSVSNRHATVQFPPFPGAPVTIEDHGSTSGTRVGERLLPPHEATTVEPDAIIALGSTVLSIRALTELHEHGLGPPAEPVHPTFGGANSAAASAPRRRHHTVVGSVQMAKARSFRIGRSRDADIVIEYPQISAHHATLIVSHGQILLEDAGSDLGTLVQGARLRPFERRVVEAGAEIHLGPIATRLGVDGDAVTLAVIDEEGFALKPSFEIEAHEVTIVVPDRLRPDQSKVLLDRVSFKALPGDLIALMGPSGAGKTTLLHTLTGALAPTSGQIRVNGRPLEAVFSSLRGSIGYVPQDDIVHPELTVREAVTYSARLRLPADYSPEEIDARVTRTLEELGLLDVAHLRIGKPDAKVLSGGQRKRVNIAMELVTDPVLLFLDEPTSGLAADDTAQLVLLLERLASQGGKTIIATIHQPARREYERFNLALILGPGGVPLYFGPTTAAYAFFESWRPPLERAHIDNPRDMFAELRERQKKLDMEPAQARAAVSALFREEYEASTIAREMRSGRRAPLSADVAHEAAPRRARSLRALGILIARYTKIKLRDSVSTAILLLQAPLIGVLLGLVFGDQKPAAPAWCYGALDELRALAGQDIDLSGLPERILPATDRAPALFFMVVSAIWFGTSNAAREIVSERAIYARERMVHLSATNYIASKFIVLSLLSILQCGALLSLLWFLLDLGGGAPAFGTELGILCLTAICSVALGLLISGLVKTSEAAMALTPIALIPQVVLGGLMVPVTTVPWLKWPMLVIPARWGFQGVIRPERLAAQEDPAWNIALGPGTPDRLPDFIDGGYFRCALAHTESETLTGALGLEHGQGLSDPAAVLSISTAVLLIFVLALLARGGPNLRRSANAGPPPPQTRG